MVSKFLDSSGLAYFWTRIKAWATALFALDSAVLHKAGSEIISGVKVVDNTSLNNSQKSSEFIVRNSSLVKGTTPDYLSFTRISFVDSTNSGDAAASDRLGAVEHAYRLDGRTEVQLVVNKPDDSNNSAAVRVGYLSDKSTVYCIIPSTRNDPGSGEAISYDWLPKDSRLVHTTGDETISGNKKFTSSIVQTSNGDYSIFAQRIGVSKGTNPTSTGKYAVVGAFEETGNLYVANRLAIWTGYVTTSGDVYSALIAYKNSSSETVNANFSCIYSSASDTVYQVSNKIRPWASDLYSLGDSSHKYTVLYASTGTINTSDERLKHDISGMPDIVLDAWASVEWKQFRMLDSVQKKGRATARLHSGAIAQQIRKAFADAGLDAAAYGFFCHDEWEQTQEVRGPEGEILMPYAPAGDVYSLRYEEALCIEAAYLRRENARLKKRVADLEERLAALELKIS